MAALQRYFERHSYPRSMLALLLLVAGAAGFLVSYGLLRMGVDHMWMRFPLAVFAGYGVLLALVRGWVELEKQSFDPDDPVLREDLAGRRSEFKSRHQPPSRGWDWLDVSPLDGIDGDEGCLPALLVGMLVLLIVAIIGALAAAPALIAEVFLDAFLVSVLYRRLRMAEQEHWLGTAIRKTWRVALITAIVLALAGWVLEELAPGARSIGRALEQLMSR